MVRETPTKSEIDNLLVQATKKVKDAKASGIEIRQPKALIERINKREKEEKLAEKARIKNMPKEQKDIEKAKKKLAEAKKRLENAQAKGDKKGIQKAQKDIKDAEKRLKKAQEAKRKKDQMGLDKLTKKMFKTEKDLEKAGAKKKEAPKKEKDDKSNEKDKEKTNDKDSKEVAKKKEAMQKKYANIKLPGGLTIKQQGPAWVLVDAKSGRTKDVTPEMESLIKTNRDIDNANKQIDKNNKQISAGQVENVAAGAKDDLQPRDKLKTNEMIDNSVAGISTGQMKVDDPTKGLAEVPTAVPDIKITDFDGKALDPATAKGLAIVAVANAFDQNDLNKMEKKLQEKLQEKDKKQKQEHEASLRQVPQKGGRE